MWWWRGEHACKKWKRDSLLGASKKRNARKRKSGRTGTRSLETEGVDDSEVVLSHYLLPRKCALSRDHGWGGAMLHLPRRGSLAYPFAALVHQGGPRCCWWCRTSSRAYATLQRMGVHALPHQCEENHLNTPRPSCFQHPFVGPSSVGGSGRRQPAPRASRFGYRCHGSEKHPCGGSFFK